MLTRPAAKKTQNQNDRDRPAKPFGGARYNNKDSKLALDEKKSLRCSVAGFALFSAGVLAIASFFIFIFFDVILARDVCLYSLAAIVVYTVFVLTNLDLIRSMDGVRPAGIGPANALTAVRIFLVAPILVSLLHGYVMAGFILYCIAALTDVFDGLMARRFHQETVLGIMLDPVGDIFVTLAVYCVLWIIHDIPLWLFILLVARYTQFFAGLAILAALGRKPTLRATVAGKIVGVVQALGIVILLARRIFFSGMSLGAIHGCLLPLLGSAFAAVIVSQTVIGCRALRAGPDRR